MGINGYPTSDIVFENVRVHKSDLVGPLNKGYAVAMSTLDGGRLGVARTVSWYCPGLSRGSNQLRKGEKTVWQANLLQSGNQLYAGRYGY